MAMENSNPPSRGGTFEHLREKLWCETASLSTTGTLHVAGWAISSVGIDKIEIIFYDHVIGTADYGAERPDVEKAFPRVPDSGRSGFVFRAQVDASKIKDENILTVQIWLRDGSYAYHKITIATQRTDAPSSLNDVSPIEILIHFDNPIIADGVAAQPVRGTLPISGWALSSDGIESVTFAIDGVNVGKARYGIRRDDLRQAFPEIKDAALGGFHLSLPQTSLPDGEHRIHASVKTTGGHRRDVEFSFTSEADAGHPKHSKPRDRIPAAEREFHRALANHMKDRPHVVVWITCNKNNVQHIVATLHALRSQTYPSWTAVVSGDPELKVAALAMLADEFPNLASRIRIFPSTSESNALFNSLKAQDLILPLDAGDRLAADALFEFSWALAQHKNSDFFYADECRENPATGRLDAFFKPDWSPSLLLASNYIGRPWCATTELVRRAKSQPLAANIAGNFDLVLRYTERSAAIHHIQNMLCERHSANLEDPEVEIAALNEAVKRRGFRASVEQGLLKNTYRLRSELTGGDLVSIIIPTCGQRDLVKTCITSLREVSSYKNIEVICIDNIPDGSSDCKLWLRRNADVVLDVPGQFNWSRFNNLAANKASGQYFLFLNDDTEVIQPDWLETMIEQCQRDDVVIVGPQLLYPDRKVQHAGMFLTDSGVGRHAFRFCAEDDPGYFGLALTTRDVIAVTGACLFVRKDVFHFLGRFEESHSVINNDLDFCLKAHEKNLKCVFTPHAKLIHHEMASRSELIDECDPIAFRQRWGSVLSAGDPYFHPSLDTGCDFYRVRIEPTETMFCGRPVYSRNDVRKILAVKVDHIGDFVTSLIAIRRLKAIFPDAELTALVAPASIHLASLEPAIDRTLVFEHFHERSALGEVAADEVRLKELARDLAAHEFDIAVDFRKHPETRGLLQLAAARITAGFDFRGQFPWLDIALEWDGDSPLHRKHQHISDDLVNLVDAIGAAGDHDRAGISRGIDWSSRRFRIAPSILKCGLFDRRVVCVHPGAGNDNKQWPPLKFAALVDMIIEEEDVNVALIGGSDEGRIATRVLEGVRHRDRVHNLVGKMTLSELPFFIDSCALFVGNDSGPKHIAAALGVPTVGIHSGVIDAREFGPFGEFAASIRLAMICSPCYLAKREDCTRNLACLEELEPYRVLPICLKMLNLGHGAIVPVNRLPTFL